MTKNIDFSTLEAILEEADLYEETYSYRENYEGRGYDGPGFGIVVSASNALPRLMVAAGTIAARGEDDAFDPMAWAKATQSDSMGYDVIFYWPGWAVTNVPDWFGGDRI